MLLLLASLQNITERSHGQMEHHHLRSIGRRNVTVDLSNGSFMVRESMHKIGGSKEGCTYRGCSGQEPKGWD